MIAIDFTVNIPLDLIDWKLAFILPLAYLYGSAGDDTVLARKDFTFLSGSDFFNRAKHFAKVYAINMIGGNDQVELRAEGSVNHLSAERRTATLSYGTNEVSVLRFDHVVATADATNNATKHVESIDFLLETVGEWREI